MMSKSNQSYKELAIPHFKEVFEIIDDVLTHHHIPYYLIGVSAIALAMIEKGIKPSRGTKDIDFAIMIASIDQYHTVVGDLELAGFKKVEAPWTMIHKAFDVVIDLLPFGEIEQNYTVGFNERYTDLHVLGFKDVLLKSSEYKIEDRVVRVPPLPGMVILKLVAWSDRPEDRSNDIYDILRVIEHFFDLEYETILIDHHDAIPEDEDFDERKFAARVLGRKAKEYLDGSKKLKERIDYVLKNNTVNSEDSDIARQWALKKGWDLEYSVSLLSEFKTGLTEGKKG